VKIILSNVDILSTACHRKCIKAHCKGRYEINILLFTWPPPP